MALPDLTPSPNGHINGHNNERHLINGIQAVSDPTFKANLDAGYGKKTIAAEAGTATGVYVYRDTSSNPNDPDIYLYNAEGIEL